MSSKNPLQLSMSVALITGCSNGGIGAALPCTSDLVHENVRKLVVDVTDDASVANGINQVYAETAGIDILISNAGYSHIGPFLDTPFEEGLNVVQTNFFGFVRLVKNVVHRMGKRGKGTVIAIGSILGELATPFQGFYKASKAALHSYTETLRMECEITNVKVVLVAPGSIRSNISVKSAYTVPEDSFYKALEKQIKHAMYLSQTKEYGVMDTDKFASTVVGKVASPNPPQYLTLGGFTTQWWILKWLRRTTAEAIIWSLAQMEPKPGTYGPMP